VQVDFSAVNSHVLYNYNFGPRDPPIKNDTNQLLPVVVKYSMSLQAIDDFEAKNGYANVLFDLWVNEVTYCSLFDIV
jgi:hypothetical protein